MARYGVTVHVIEPGLFKTSMNSESSISRLLDLSWKRLQQSTQQEFGDKYTKECNCFSAPVKGMEHVPNILMSFDKYLFLEVINILV